MRNHNKRWLISRMKTSGSKRDHLRNGAFGEERNTKKYRLSEDMPFRESIQRTGELYNGKINTNLIARFLRGNINKLWPDVYQEIIGRIPKQLLHYQNLVLWYVSDKVEFIDGNLFDLREQKFLIKEGEYGWRTTTLEFYVDPIDNRLKYIADLLKNVPQS
jgi:hypothetical protein